MFFVVFSGIFWIEMDYKWAGLDSNQRRLTPTGLQPVPFSRSGTDPICRKGILVNRRRISTIKPKVCKITLKIANWPKWLKLRKRGIPILTHRMRKLCFFGRFFRQALTRILQKFTQAEQFFTRTSRFLANFKIATCAFLS